MNSIGYVPVTVNHRRSSGRAACLRKKQREANRTHVRERITDVPGVEQEIAILAILMATTSSVSQFGVFLDQSHDRLETKGLGSSNAQPRINSVVFAVLSTCKQHD